MAGVRESAAGRTPQETVRSPLLVDRVLIGGCVVIWLVLLGVSVAATVALVDLARGHPKTPDSTQTPWLLYTVIGVSALIIVGAIPLLIRARRSATTDPRTPTTAAGSAAGRPERPAAPSPRPPGGPIETNTERLRVFGSLADRWDRYQPDFVVSTPSRRTDPLMPATELDRMWLRCTVEIVAAMGLGLVAVATATYLMAVEMDSAAWAAYGVAGVITVLMPVIPWLYLRRLRDTIADFGDNA